MTTILDPTAVTVATDALEGSDRETEPLLRVRNLRVSFGRGRHATEVVHGIDFEIAAHRTLAIVGESGSGKSVTARALIGLAGAGSTVTADELSFGGQSLLDSTPAQWRARRGKEIGFVLQDALVSLDPLRPSGKEVEEALLVHQYGDKQSRWNRVIEVLREVGVPEPELRALQRSGELSGGLRQRALIASALVLDPSLVIADEPTTALDTTVQSQVIRVLNSAKTRGKTLLLISHDLGVVAQLADHVLVMRHGKAVEFGTAERVLNDPAEDYTKSLLGAIPSARTKGRRLSSGESLGAPASQGMTRQAPAQDAIPDAVSDAVPVLSVRDISKHFTDPRGGRTTAVAGVSFELHRGQTLGIVGESGSGKTTASRIALGLISPDGGEVLLDGQSWSALTERERRPRRRCITAVYQDPLGSFDPRWSVGEILRDALPDETGNRRARQVRVVELLDAVGLTSGHAERRPLTLSGGQRQRVAIARAIASDPEVIVLDEPVSALDASIQAQVLDLFADLQRERNLSYLFISHDLGVISHASDHVIVMKEGRVVESGNATALFTNPQHDYTKALLSAVPAVSARG